MQVDEILAGLDQEIARLQQARALLAGDQPRRGRPRGSKTKTAAPAKAAKATGTGARKKRKLSAEGRKRIAEAMRKRWAERKKTANS